MVQNNSRLKSELGIVAKALDNSLRKIKKHQQRYAIVNEVDEEIVRKDLLALI